jgi:hypothetical protein
MMAKTGICSIVVIATPTRMSFSLHAKKIKPRVQPFFKRLQAPKMKGVRTCFTDAVLVEKFISWLQQKTLLILMMMAKSWEVLLVALTLKR